MAQERLPMYLAREVLRLRYDCGLSNREVARACHVNRETVAVYLKRAEKAGLRWPLPDGLSDAELEAIMFPAPAVVQGVQRPLPDWQHIYDELRSFKKTCNLTLMQLWVEYKEVHPDGLQYSQFCERYHRWLSKRDYVMRQEHRAGEKMFVDFCDGLFLTNPQTGEMIPTHLFVGVWGFSNLTYAEAVLNQAAPAWSRCHVHAFNYSQAVPRALVPDNLKSGVTKPCYYEPKINRSYAELAAHYGTAVLPAAALQAARQGQSRGRRARGPALDPGVLRHRIFFTLAELNAAIHELLEGSTAGPCAGSRSRAVSSSRRRTDRPPCPCPRGPTSMLSGATAKVHIDYAIEIDRPLLQCSVPPDP